MVPIVHNEKFNYNFSLATFETSKGGKWVSQDYKKRKTALVGTVSQYCLTICYLTF
jgi:hypothetical protein